MRATWEERSLLTPTGLTTAPVLCGPQKQTPPLPLPPALGLTGGLTAAAAPGLIPIYSRAGIPLAQPASMVHECSMSLTDSVCSGYTNAPPTNPPNQQRPHPPMNNKQPRRSHKQQQTTNNTNDSQKKGDARDETGGPAAAGSPVLTTRERAKPSGPFWPAAGAARCSTQPLQAAAMVVCWQAAAVASTPPRHRPDRLPGGPHRGAPPPPPSTAAAGRVAVGRPVGPTGPGWTPSNTRWVVRPRRAGRRRHRHRCRSRPHSQQWQPAPGGGRRRARRVAAAASRAPTGTTTRPAA